MKQHENTVRLSLQRWDHQEFVIALVEDKIRHLSPGTSLIIKTEDGRPLAKLSYPWSWSLGWRWRLMPYILMIGFIATLVLAMSQVYGGE